MSQEAATRTGSFGRFLENRWGIQCLAFILLMGTVPGAVFGQEAQAAQGPSQERQKDLAQEQAPEAEGDEEEKPFADDEDHLSVYDEIEIRERGDDLIGIAGAASEGSTGAEQLAKRPILRAGEVVETVPGVIATQHSGGGKANQYFLRGFNLDHGTDFSMSVAGVPVNMPTHGHGQGYSDLNFLIPEVIDRVRFQKGTYSAEKGDFSAAGSVDMDLVSFLPEGILQITGGENDYTRLVLADSFKVGGGDLLAALEVFQDDGPWTRGDDYERFNGALRYRHGDALKGGSLTLLGSDGDWLATDQIPLRAVEDGRIGRFDLIDPGPRGSTDRYSLSGELHRGDARSFSRLEVWGLYYDFGLISQFTYLLDDPVRGDQFEQADNRWAVGVHASQERSVELGGRQVETKVGVQIRYDDIENGLFRTQDLVRFGTVREDEIRLFLGGVYSEASVRWSRHFRTTFGLRADSFQADVTSDLPINSGNSDDFLLSPKLQLAFGPWNDTELYLSLGTGFHSNDARGTTVRVDPVTGEQVDRVEPLVQGQGAEIGLRSSGIEGLQTTVSIFILELDSELVFVGDAGATEASRPSRRVGVEWTNYATIRPWLTFDLDIAITDAEFTDDDPAGSEIPGALSNVIATGFSISDLEGWFGSLRLRYFSDFPLIEDGSVEAGSTTQLAGRIGYEFPNGLSVALEGFNLLDREDADITYFYASRLPGEPAGGIEDVHFHPIEPASARLTATWRF